MTANADPGVELWLARLEGTAPAAALALLSEEEMRRVARIRHAQTRAGFVAGRALARLALSHRAPVEPRAWRFEPTSLGRPEIIAPATTTGLRFNISHAAGLAACVTTRSLDCGVDVESLERRVDSLRIARHSFASEEVETLAGLAGAQLTERFFALWTLKEAYLKARGAGIRLRLDAVAFRLDPAGSIVARLASGEPRSVGWQFALFRPAENALLALALAADRPVPVEVRELDLASSRTAPRELAPLASGAA